MKDNIKNNYFDSRFKFDLGRKKVWDAIVDHLQPKFFNNIETVVELGCGYGDFINSVKALNKIAVDINDCKDYLRSDVKFYKKNVIDLEFIKTNSVDLVFASNLVEHLVWEEIDKMIHEVRRVLKKSSKLILIQPNYRLCSSNYFDDYTHRTILSDVSLKDYLKSQGFRINYVNPSYLPFSMQGILPKTYFLTKLYLELNSPILGKQMLVVSENEN